MKIQNLMLAVMAVGFVGDAVAAPTLTPQQVENSPNFYVEQLENGKLSNEDKQSVLNVLSKLAAQGDKSAQDLYNKHNRSSWKTYTAIGAGSTLATGAVVAGVYYCYINPEAATQHYNVVSDYAQNGYNAISDSVQNGYDYVANTNAAQKVGRAFNTTKGAFPSLHMPEAVTNGYNAISGSVQNGYNYVANTDAMQTAGNKLSGWFNWTKNAFTSPFEADVSTAVESQESVDYSNVAFDDYIDAAQAPSVTEEQAPSVNATDESANQAADNALFGLLDTVASVFQS